MPGYPVLRLPEFAETHVHQVSDTIQPSHPLSPHLLLPSVFPSISIFCNGVGSLHQVAKVLRLLFSISPSNEYSGLISFRTDSFDLLAVQGTHESSPTPQFKSINSSVLSLLYGPTHIHI